MTCKNCKKKISVEKPQMGDIAPKEKKEKSPGVIDGSKTPALNDLGRANTITLGKRVV